MEQLKKCPFCGGEAKIQKHKKRGYYVICTYCGCRTPFFEHPFFLKKKLQECAITAWNTRKPMERIEERLEELRMAEYDDSDEEPVYNDFDDIFDDGVSSGKFKAYLKAIEIVKEEM